MQNKLNSSTDRPNENDFNVDEDDDEMPLRLPPLGAKAPETSC